ncbi:MAG TPA: hypothetical protein VH143_32040 [Kofleriaceae bacterium]|jgi:hypothetical protein|nr:hypothetical protein [Kofleriaceae bacterium]
MRSWPLALCGIASCGWIAGVGSYTTTGDGGSAGPSDANVSGDAPANACTTGFGSNGLCATSLTAGVGETCLIGPDAMYCWGQNIIGVSTPAYTPVKLQLGPTPISVQLSSSADTTSEPQSAVSVGCYLGSDGGSLTCWGDSSWGQVQVVVTDYKGAATMVPQVITAYAVGADHVCASGANASIVCWGRSDEDELNAPVGVTCGPGFCSTEFVQTNSIQTRGAFVAGAAHTCVGWNSLGALDDIACWGDNEKGQLGGASGVMYDVVEQVVMTNGTESLGSASELALGASHTCAIVGVATYCWGANDRAQLGVGGMSSSTPIVLATAPTFVHIAAGTNTTCGIDTSGAVLCWGDNTQGQAGQGPGSTDFMPMTVPEPTPVAGIANATMISVGDLHACAGLADGDIMCWGDNQFGELGDGSDMHPAFTCAFGDCSPTPVRVTKL